MRSGIFWGDLGCSRVSWGYQTDPLNKLKLSQKSAVFLSNQHLQASRPYK